MSDDVEPPVAMYLKGGGIGIAVGATIPQEAYPFVMIAAAAILAAGVVIGVRAGDE